MTVLPLAKSVSWMNGIQFYLKENVVINDGHVIYLNSQWALTSISQTQYWGGYDLSTLGGEKYKGKVHGILSVDISDWLWTKYPDKNGILAEDCKTADEVAKLVWVQLVKSLNVDGQTVLAENMDDMVVAFRLDRDIDFIEKAIEDKDREPLLVNTINSWRLRPNAKTMISNFMLASDYVRTNTDLATMEGANEAARRAVNGIIADSGAKVPYCELWDLTEPWLLSPMKWYDQKQFIKGLPYNSNLPWWLKLFMIPWGLTFGLFTIIKAIQFYIFGAVEKTELARDRSTFIFFSMVIAILGLVGCAYWWHGYVSATFWGYGFSFIYIVYAILKKDALLGRFIFFGACAGWIELLPDHWIVADTGTLVYPPHEPIIDSSPAYMPFSWLVVFIQIGYIGYLLSYKYSMVRTCIIMLILGSLLIPFYEYLAIDAGWWSYKNTPMIFHKVPYYIILAEGLLMVSIPPLYRVVEKTKFWFIPLWGILQGMIMWLCTLIAFYLVGK